MEVVWSWYDGFMVVLKVSLVPGTSGSSTRLAATV
jgi:hypothetical protein